MTKKHLKGGTLVTLNEPNEIIENGSVVIKGNEIFDFGKSSEMEEKHDFEEEIEATGKIIMPGLINAHHHLYSTFARGMNISGESPSDFEETLEKVWWKLDKNLRREDIYYSALVSLIECVRKGTTTILDHHESQSHQKGSLDEIARAVGESGIKASLCLGTSDRYGNGEEGVEENGRFLSKLESESPDLLKGMVGLHASFTVEDETLDKSAELADRYNVGVHFHCAEGKIDQEESLNRSGKRVVERLNSFGILGEKSIAIHGVYLDENELEILRNTGTNLVHNPESNMNNAVGYADVLKMMENGIRVGLGTDGMSGDMLSQMRCAFLLHPHEKGNPKIGFVEAPKMLLKNNPEIIKKTTGWEVGKIEKGCLADLIAIDYYPPTPLNENNFLGHLIYGLVNSSVDTTICNGSILMRNKELIGFDEAKIAEEARGVASEIWERIRTN